MKRYFLALFSITLLFVSCGEKEPEQKQEQFVPVSSVTVSPSYPELAIGETVQLTATVKPANATEKTILWSSSNQSVATVSNSGLVTSIAEGTATITATAGGKSAESELIVKTIHVWGVSLTQTSVSINIGETVTLIAAISPDRATNKTVNWSSSKPTVAEVSSSGVVQALSSGITTISVETVDGGHSASCEVTVIDPGVPKGAVDLGLSVYWADCNLDAGYPEDYGGYYAWGETEAKHNITSYKWSDDGGSHYTKYGNVDGKMVLDPDDDAAYVKLGGNWRMPTPSEWIELMTTCNWFWQCRGNIGNWVNGQMFLAENGNSIFIPAAGYWFLNGIGRVDSYGLYWSSSLDSVTMFANVFIVSPNYVRIDTQPRNIIMSIRPVCSK